MNTGALTFPGVSFEVASPQSTDTLPRMDIAALVGYASVGPLHVPVMIEDSQRFREIFGDDLPLAWDPKESRFEYSCLGAAVELFFKNGGKRCWVVRVADETIAETSSWQVPGLFQTMGANLAGVSVNSRSPGSWAAAIKMGTALEVRHLVLLDSPSATSPTEPVIQINQFGFSLLLNAVSGTITKGDLLHVERAEDNLSVWLYVAEVIQQGSGFRVSGTQGYWSQVETFSPPVDGAFTDSDNLYSVVSLVAATELEYEYFADESPAVAPSLRLVTFELLGWIGERLAYRVQNLSFHASHPRFWGNIPSDEQFFSSLTYISPETRKQYTKQLSIAIDNPRIPFAAPEFAADWHYLPLGLVSQINKSVATTAIYLQQDRLVQNGLLNTGAAHFLDSNLQWSFTRNLKNEALNRVFIANPPARLRGIYSILPIDEITLLCAPDAIHRRWDQSAPPFKAFLSAAELLPVSAEQQTNCFLVEWTAVDGCSSYRLQWSQDPDFNSKHSRILVGETIPRVGVPSDLIATPDTSTLLGFDTSCNSTFFVRVRAEHNGDISAWSNSRAFRVPTLSFEDCDYTSAAILDLLLSVNTTAPIEPVVSPSLSGHFLQWQFNNNLEITPEVDFFEIQKSSDLTFLYTEVVDSADADQFSPADPFEYFVPSQADTVVYYRIRALSGNTKGPWSNTLMLTPGYVSRVVFEDEIEFAKLNLLAVHRSMLRVCATRGDMLAMMAFPKHFDTSLVEDYMASLYAAQDAAAESLTTGIYDAAVSPLGVGEHTAFSYGAAYFPWLYTELETRRSSLSGTRLVPPDGVVCGSLARITLSLGAWMAPANKSFNSVLALSNTVDRSIWSRLTALHVNPLQHTAGGYMALHAETLSMHPRLQEINVRRLMCLLLRLVEREGKRFVFENNSNSFRDTIKLYFDGVLERLYSRGAFAGRTPDQAFRVVLDDSVNPLSSIAAGRLVVEFHVAPSVPLKFIKIRLVDQSPGQLQLQEMTQ